MRSYTGIILLFVILFIAIKRRREVIAKKAVKKAIERRKKGGHNKMVELAKRFIDEECIIYKFDNGAMVHGIIKEVSENGLLVEYKGTAQIINIDYVSRIQKVKKK